MSITSMISIILPGLLMMLAYLGLFFWLADRPGKGLAVAAGSLLFFLCMGVLAPLVMAGLLFVFWGCGWCLGLDSPRVYRGLAALALVVGMGLPAMSVLGRMQELAAARETYAIESLEERLAYEGPKPTEAAARLPPDVEQNLHFAEESTGNHRNVTLQMLHRNREGEFRRAMGFGPSRMIRVHVDGLKVPERPPAQLPEYLPPDPPGDASEEGSPAVPADSPRELTSIAKSNLESAHFAGVRDFVSSVGESWVVEPRKAAGFTPHGMSQWREQSEVKLAESQYAIVRLELVSLLKHPTPRAYVSKDLPQMEALQGVPTRPLDSFETKALPQLAGRDLVIDSRAANVRMLGSIRASNRCLECHHVRRGDLLGAFTYELRPRVAVPPREKPARPEL